MSSELFRIEVNQIGEYVQMGSCPRRFKLDLNGRELAKKVPFFTRALNPLDPVLQEMGREREERWELSLIRAGHTKISSKDEDGERQSISWEEFVERLGKEARPGAPFYAREVELSGTIGRFSIHGRCDFIVLHWKDGKPKLRVVECKASRKDKTYHRVQLAAYVLLIRAYLADGTFNIAGHLLEASSLEGVVARIDEKGDNQEIMSLPSFDLTTEMEDVLRLLSEGGELDRITSTDIDELSYRIDRRCDPCVFSVICLPESARCRRLELLDMDPSSLRVLRENGIGDIDDLAELDARSETALRIRRSPGFVGNLTSLISKAKARRATLPGSAKDGYEVEKLPGLQIGSLPAHEGGDGRLVRVYMSVDYDYVEDRIGGLSAHVTTSPYRVHTPYVMENGRFRPFPGIVERSSDDGGTFAREKQVSGSDVIMFRDRPWTRDRAKDDAGEAELISSFFNSLVEAMVKEAGKDSAPVHFYIWKRDEMSTLIEGCSRCGGGLLEHLSELMGCRQPLEQLIFTSLDEEVRSRYALGWSGSGLAVVSSLRWFGERYHWHRTVEGREVDLSDVFRQGIFDFSSPLALREDGSWARPGEEGTPYVFEVRSRNHDSLPVPYWHAVWGTLPSPDGPMKYTTRETIKRFMSGGDPALLREYLRARVMALRWVEERIFPKNKDIRKPALDLTSLKRFRLPGSSPARAAVDFLRMDHHVKFNDWMAMMSLPPLDRVSQGLSVPVKDVQTIADESCGEYRFYAKLDLERFGETTASFRDKMTVDLGSWVRLVPYDGDILAQQGLKDMLFGGRTCMVEQLDLEKGTVVLKVMLLDGDRYRLPSLTPKEGLFCQYATLDDSPSDMVAGRVEHRLLSAERSAVMSWFDMTSPMVPAFPELGPGACSRYEALLKDLEFDGVRLGDDQVKAILDGLSARVQLMQGPPGTGKTTTTAVATLLRTVRQGPGEITLVAANTHMAIDRLIDDIRKRSGPFLDGLRRIGASPVPIGVYNMKELEKERSYWHKLNQLRGTERLIVGGTTNEVLKLAQKMDSVEPYRSGHGFKVSCLVVDEASMMVMSHFLALASLVDAQGTIMLSGDGRQLSPITAHDWDNEDRPSFVRYQPFTSAFDAVDSLIRSPGNSKQMICRSALDRTYRLPSEVVELISGLYQRDGIELKGSKGTVRRTVEKGKDPFSVVWKEGGIFLIVHDEGRSKRTNRFEASLIEEVVRASNGLDPSSVAVMTPHRAQRALLQEVLRPYSVEVDIIDTVERLQGGERATVIVSGTQSDPSSISSTADFILDLNRSNVIFSRTKERLVVVCSQALLDSVPSDTEQYMSAYLWKRLRGICKRELTSFEWDGHKAKLMVPDLENVTIIGADGQSNFERPCIVPRKEARSDLKVTSAGPKGRRSLLGPPPRTGIVVDGSNVALHGTDGKKASPEQLKRCYEDLVRTYGFTDVYIIIGPGLRHKMTPEEFEELERHFEAKAAGLDHKILLQAPAGAYDDLFTIRFAIYDDLLILTNDRYRDIIERSPEYEYDIRTRSVRYMFPGGSLIVEKWPDYVM
ncbi:MAG: AAA family ATPase [Methanomassiliicoccales archaeon]|nr:MAG: AAA family ATPase [Methanomassiliicoccales archaeon]